MEAKVRTACEETLKALAGLHDSKVIDDDVYHKGVVAIAYEYGVGGELGTAIALILRVPASYYQDVQLKQMMVDPNYAEVCVALADLIRESGLLVGVDIPLPPGAARA